MPLTEAQFDGLVGPTHNYAGLAFGNVASLSNTGEVSRPRAAALQGLDKAAFVMSLGVVQGVLPPHERPHIPTLRRLGFEGSDPHVLESAWHADPTLVAQVSSASCMWTANAATVAPASDTANARLHAVPANLVSMVHRSIEPPTTQRILQSLLPSSGPFTVHEPLNASPGFGDEGAANHTRLYSHHQPERFCHLFVYGVEWNNRQSPRPTRFPARQTLEASRAVARLCRLPADRCIFAQQDPKVIDEGVFHNDVIAVGSGRVLLYHQRAFLDENSVLDRCRQAVGAEFVPVCISENDVPVADVVSSYLFNSQLLALGPDRYELVMPSESRHNARVWSAVQRIIADPANPIVAAHPIDVRESMRNGGGPACLRLRVPLQSDQLARINQSCLLDVQKLQLLRRWVERYYPQELRPADLVDPLLLRTGRDALDELTRLLALGPVYDFQRA